MRDVIDDIKEAFLTGVSYMLPFVVAGGILVALGFLLGGYNIPSVEPYGSTFASTIFWIGKIWFRNIHGTSIRCICSILNR